MRGRAENARSQLPNARAKLGALASTEQPSEAAPAEVIDVSPVAEGLTNKPVLCRANKNLFVRNLFNYIGEKLPDFKIVFEQPQEGYCFTVSFHKNIGLSVKYGCILGKHQTSG